MALRPSDGPDLVIWPSLEAYLTNFDVIWTHLSCYFHPAVDFLGLRRNASSSQVINQAQDLLEQASWDRNLGQLESDIAAMTNDLGPNLHQFLPQRGQRPMLNLLRQDQSPHEVGGGQNRPAKGVACFHPPGDIECVRFDVCTALIFIAESTKTSSNR